MPCGDWTITDVPDTSLGTVVGIMKIDQPLKIETKKQNDGKWTVVGFFPPCLSGEGSSVEAHFELVKQGLSIDKLISG